ncbi:MAG: heme o synthase [Candidatus Korobacteraceae bacterium]
MNTAVEGFSLGRLKVAPLFRDYAELTKSRITTLIVITAWCGFFFGARQAGEPAISWRLLHALLGIALVSSGTAALNEVMEHDVDRKMRRTARRPIPAGRMSLLHATVVGSLFTIGGSIYLIFFTNWLTGLLTFLTSVVYLAAYTPLKRVSPICTFVGAFPGAMPAVLGWTAARGRLDWGALILFAILFLWQFPHFFAIAWLYREDYAKGAIRMLPVVEPDGRSTSFRIMLYSLVLVPASLIPALLSMTGKIYFGGAALLGVVFLYFAARLIILNLPVNDVRSKVRARQLFRYSILYLPLLFALMMSDSVRW